MSTKLSSPAASEFDFKSPDYAAVLQKRVDALQRLRANPKSLPALKLYYRDNPAQFISDWGMTIDPKNVERGLPTVIPFILFDKQREWVDWVVKHWKDQRPGLTEKTRQMGFSWLSVATACTLCLFYPGMSVGFGSRKEEYVDKLGSPKSLLQRARVFMSLLPEEFKGGWDVNKHAPFMRIIFPESGGIISGEAGDNIGRGDTTSIYFVDESAHLERPHLVEASLSQTTNCRIDISTPNGLANPFAEKRMSGKIDVFTFHWQDDPRKDEAWYQRQKEILDPITLAQEIDIDYAASVEGFLLPVEWVRSAIDAHQKLKIKPAGIKTGALDVADEGYDKNAFAGRHGILLEHLQEWSGKGKDIFDSVEKAFNAADLMGYQAFDYDADGLGAGVRGDARIINERRIKAKKLQLRVTPFRGSGEVLKPESEMVEGRKNKDLFANRKAQAWWELRARFLATHRAVAEGMKCNPDDIISLPGSLSDLAKLQRELTQVTYSFNNAGKMLIDKQPEGTHSPNLADAVMICFATSRRPLEINDELLQSI